MVLIIKVGLVDSGNIRKAWIKEWGAEIFKWFRLYFIML
jgi:hypothetical protein